MIGLIASWFGLFLLGIIVATVLLLFCAMVWQGKIILGGHVGKLKEEAKHKRITAAQERFRAELLYEDMMSKNALNPGPQGEEEEEVLHVRPGDVTHPDGSHPRGKLRTFIEGG